MLEKNSILRMILIDLRKDAQRALSNKFAVLYFSMFFIANITVVYLVRYNNTKINDCLLFIIFFVYLVTFTTAVLMQKILLVKIPEKSVILVNGHMTHSWEKPAWIWRTQYKEYMFGGKAELVSYAAECEVVCIDINNDVNLNCGIWLVRQGTKKDLIEWKKFLNRQDGLRSKSLKEFAEYFGYEFVQDQRIPLDKLYNPADKFQQEEYRDSLKTFLCDYLEGGEFLSIGCGSEFNLITRPSHKDIFG